MIASGCGDLAPPDDTTLSESDLLFLAVQAGAPSVPSGTFWVSNAREVTQRLLHADAFGTLFAEVRFPRACLATLDGRALGADDSVRVTLQPSGGRYRITVSPSGLVFSSAARPHLTFSYGRYGDLSVADAAYASRSEYADALRLWAESAPGVWERVGSTGSAGADVVGGPVTSAGTLGAAAAR